MARTRGGRGQGRGRGRGRGESDEGVQEDTFVSSPEDVEAASIPAGNMQDRFKLVGAEKIYRFLEKDFRDLFNGENGSWFKERMVRLGWFDDLIVGSAEWWCSPSYLDYFKKNFRKCGNFDAEVDLKGTKGWVVITREMISDVTGIPLGDDREVRSETLAARECLLSGVLDKLAPYRHPRHCVSSSSLSATAGGFVDAKGLQRNVALFAKWVTVNILGNQSPHFIRAEAAWITHHLMFDTLPAGFCLCDFLLSSLRGYDRARSYPLPCLVSRLMGVLTGDGKPDDAISYSRGKKERKDGALVKTDVFGLWDGIVRVGDARPRVVYSKARGAQTRQEDEMEEVLGEGVAADTTGVERGFMADARRPPRPSRVVRDTRAGGASSSGKGGGSRGFVGIHEVTMTDYTRTDTIDRVTPSDHKRLLWNGSAMNTALLLGLYARHDWPLPTICRQLCGDFSERELRSKMINDPRFSEDEEEDEDEEVEREEAVEEEVGEETQTQGETVADTVVASGEESSGEDSSSEDTDSSEFLNEFEMRQRDKATQEKAKEEARRAEIAYGKRAREKKSFDTDSSDESDSSDYEPLSRKTGKSRKK